MANDRIRKKALKRWENDPAWFYILLGMVCVGAAILYALHGDHTIPLINSKFAYLRYSARKRDEAVF